MSYSATREYLFGLQKHGIRPGLETIARLLDDLGRPQAAYPTLHIGGTNGKGSTAAMAAAMLQAAGHRVGLYTSPHLVDFRERIRVNGAMIPEAALAGLTDRLRPLAAEGVPPTFFEFTTALAFQYFADARVEVAVVEVGLGGRF
ncbi:MAG: bifunctional folylpolyglutamate synthase/dihydrofolate synthase, partial [Nitrospirota bacterium]|nr:bifunctional folylpolyglutamate synthase/dihydrofolate synthase [Nitrospirota bacterium]